MVRVQWHAVLQWTCLLTYWPALRFSSLFSCKCLVHVNMVMYQACFCIIVSITISILMNVEISVKAGQSCFERPEPRGRFLAAIRIRYSIFPSNAKKDSPFVLFTGRLRKVLLFSAPIRTIWLHYCSFQLSSASSDRPFDKVKSTLATSPAWQLQLTRRVGSWVGSTSSPF